MWKLLLDYTPIDTGQLDTTLKRKRNQYFEIVKNYFGDFENESVTSLVPDSKATTRTQSKISLSEFEKKNFK